MVLQRIEGVEEANVSYEAGKAVVTYDPTVTTPEKFIPEMERMTGYGVEVMDGAAVPDSPTGGDVDPDQQETGDAHEHEHELEAGSGAHQRASSH